MTIKTIIRGWANSPTKKEQQFLRYKLQLQAQKDEEDAQRKIDNQKKANEESAQVRALKKQLELVEELLDKSYTQIREQSNIITEHKQGDWMDKLVDKGIDVAEKMFSTPKPINITPSSKQATPETPDGNSPKTETLELDNVVSGGFSSQQIKEMINSFDLADIKKGASAPYFLFSKTLKAHYPEATQENILEAYNLTQARAENEK